MRNTCCKKKKKKKKTKKDGRKMLCEDEFETNGRVVSHAGVGEGEEQQA